ncbi:MAG: hypothetical protein M1814_006576 [Vezdaea aestivalis]|nr:MAG: hypothetical protein M1814_006576 [Vezdaea aestivalis]
MSTSPINRRIFNPELYTSIRKLWFAGLDPSATLPTPPAIARWFPTDAGIREEIDRSCSTQFEPALKSLSPSTLAFKTPFATAGTKAARDEDERTVDALFGQDIRIGEDLSEEKASLNALSLVLLFDQMTRNIYRKDQGLIYSHYDRVARALVRLILSGSPRLHTHESISSPVYKMWLYIPLMHSESLEDHKLFSGFTQDMKNDMESKKDEAAAKFFGFQIEYEKKHRDIIEKFGRYPYRNSVLGRDTTPEETKWLEEGGDTFGTSS